MASEVERDNVQMDADKAFEHLQQLVDALPQMKELGERVRLGRAAEQAALFSHDAERAQAALAQCEDGLAAARAAYDQAVQSGDAQAAEVQSHEVLFWADQVALAKGPVNDAAFHMQKLLSREGLKSAEEALTHAMSADELATLDAQIASYQADYQQTLTLCQELGE